MTYLHKGKAWFYVSLAGLLNSIPATLDFFKIVGIHLPDPLFWGVTFLIASAGTYYVSYLMSDVKAQKYLSELSGNIVND